MQWIISSIEDNRVIRDNFDCEVSELNEFLVKYAKQNHKKNIAKTWVAIPADGERHVLGYYSISMADLEKESLPNSFTQGLPRYPIPVMRIGKLAVSQSMQGKGLGEYLLIDAFAKAIRLSTDIGVFGVIVDAINDSAKLFYLKYGFIPLIDRQYSLFIPLKKIQDYFTI